MSFQLSDLTIESVLRDGFAAIRRDPSILDDVFAQLKNLGPLMTAKYGDKEIRKIKTFFETQEISIVQSFSQVVANLPCISIQLIDNPENVRFAHLDDFEEDVQTPITDFEELSDLVIASGLELLNYDALSGTVYVTDASDLSKIHANHILVDPAGAEFTITGGIVDTPGAKQFIVQPGAEVTLGVPAQIKSSINFKQYEKRGVVEDEKLLLGLHTEERLLTIYLYILVKYFIVSRKKDLMARGFQLSTYSGSDFTRNQEYVEPVFTRYLTLSGMTQNSWISDKVIPLDALNLDVRVKRARAGNAELNREDQTVKVVEDDEV